MVLSLLVVAVLLIELFR